MEIPKAKGKDVHEDMLVRLCVTHAEINLDILLVLI